MSTALWVGPAEDADRYLLTELRSRGAEGELWVGWVSVGEQQLPIAVKSFFPSSGVSAGTMASKVRDQAELLRSLDHPNLVKVREAFVGPAPHEQGKADSTTEVLYLAMNWAPGENLEGWVARNPERDPLQVTRIVSRIAAAVDELHSGRSTGGMPILHRDIKPANIVVEGESVRLVDFGLAQFATGEYATVAGTPAYLAPEVLAGAVPGEAADRFGVGAVAYFLFVGVAPDLTNIASMRSKLVQVSGIADVDGFADHLLAMLDPDPNRRPTDLVEWSQGLALGTVSRSFSSVPKMDPHPQASPTSRKAPFVVAALLVLVGAIGIGAFVFLGKSEDGENSSQHSETEDSTEDDSGSDVESEAGQSETTAEVGEVEVPNVVGMELSEARESLEEDGFSVSVEYQESGEDPDTVISQDPPSGTSDVSTVTVVVASAPKVLPDVTGLQLSEALAELEKLGATVTTSDVLDEDSPDGLVLSQDPAGGAPFAEEVSLEVARQPVITYLTDMSVVEGGIDGGGLADLSGDPYTRSITIGRYQDSAGFDLSRNYRRFRASVGLLDSSPSEASMKLEILGDGRVLFSDTFALGDVGEVDVDVTGVLRLTISAVNIGDEYGMAVFGDAALLGSASEVVTATTLP